MNEEGNGEDASVLDLDLDPSCYCTDNSDDEYLMSWDAEGRSLQLIVLVSE